MNFCVVLICAIHFHTKLVLIWNILAGLSHVDTSDSIHHSALIVLIQKVFVDFANVLKVFETLSNPNMWIGHCMVLFRGTLNPIPTPLHSEQDA